MSNNCQIIVPVENGFIVMPYSVDTLHRVQSDVGLLVARDVHELKNVVGELYDPANKGPGDTS